MRSADTDHSVILPDVLWAEVEAAAADEHRGAHDVVREAVERYVRERQPFPRAKLTPREAGARILESRPRHILPQGMTIREMIDHGRA